MHNEESHNSQDRNLIQKIKMNDVFVTYGSNPAYLTAHKLVELSFFSEVLQQKIHSFTWHKNTETNNA